MHIFDEEGRRYRSVASNLLHAAGWFSGAVSAVISVVLSIGAGPVGDEFLYLGIAGAALFATFRALQMEVRVVDGRVVSRNLFSTRSIPLDEIREFESIGVDTVEVGARLTDGRLVSLSAVASFRRGKGKEIFSRRVTNSLNVMLAEWRSTGRT